MASPSSMSRTASSVSAAVARMASAKSSDPSAASICTTALFAVRCDCESASSSPCRWAAASAKRKRRLRQRMPSRLGRAALRGDDEVTVAVRSVKQRKDELLARLAAGGGQQQCWRCDFAPSRHVYRVHVPLGPAAGEIAAGVLNHKIRQVRSNFRFSHHSLLSEFNEYSATIFRCKKSESSGRNMAGLPPWMRQPS